MWEPLNGLGKVWWQGGNSNLSLNKTKLYKLKTLLYVIFKGKVLRKLKKKIATSINKTVDYTNQDKQVCFFPQDFKK